MPRWIPFTVASVLVALLIPLALVARARVLRSDKPALHLFLDMDAQQKYKAQSENPLFGDRSAARAPVAGSVASSEVDDSNNRPRLPAAIAV